MAANSEAIRFAGDVNIDKIEIISLNGFSQEVTNQVIAIEIYEDIWSPFISGVLAFKESIDFINLFPFIGEEYVNVKIHTPSFTGKDKVIDDQFYCFKVNNREMAADHNMIYELHFISREAVVDLNKKVSKSYEGKVSDIAKQIITDTTYGLESKKTPIIEDTPNGVKFISNFWSPVKALNYAAGNATNKNGASSYIFYENRNGLNFVSMELLYQQKPLQDFVYDGWMRDYRPDGSSIRNIDKEYKRILEIRIPEIYDYIERSKSGMFSSKMISWDQTTKKYVAKNFDMLTDFPQDKHLNKYPVTSNKNIRRSNAMLINYTKYYNNFNNYTDVTNAKTLQKRISTLEQAEANKVEISVPGRTDYTVGSLVSLQLYKFRPVESTDTDNDTIDKMFSGNYIVAAINHSIDRDMHECHMELIKDSYLIDLNKGQ
jgi:hypothetical protein